jgi:hypothetical protein
MITKLDKNWHVIKAERRKMVIPIFMIKSYVSGSNWADCFVSDGKNTEILLYFIYVIRILLSLQHKSHPFWVFSILGFHVIYFWKWMCLPDSQMRFLYPFPFFSSMLYARKIHKMTFNDCHTFCNKCLVISYYWALSLHKMC